MGQNPAHLIQPLRFTRESEEIERQLHKAEETQGNHHATQLEQVPRSHLVDLHSAPKSLLHPIPVPSVSAAVVRIGLAQAWPTNPTCALVFPLSTLVMGRISIPSCLNQMLMTHCIQAMETWGWELGSSGKEGRPSQWKVILEVKESHYLRSSSFFW